MRARLAFIFAIATIQGALARGPDSAETKKSRAPSAKTKTEKPPAPTGVAALVQAELAEVLMIPSLTKEQQTRIRNLYLDYRPRSLKKWANLQKVNQKSSAPAPTVGSEILAGLVSSPDAAPSHIKKQEMDAKMQDFDRNLKKSLLAELLKEYVRFNRDVLSVLTREQRKELRQISMKFGVPDYFVKLDEDMKKVGLKPAD